MACRRVVTARQMTAARLMVVDGMSAYRALSQAGYARSTARMFGMLLRGSWGLREAIRLEQESHQHYLRPAPGRRRRYDRRSVARAVQTYCGTEDRDSTSNVWLHKLHRDTKHCQAIAGGKPMRPARCSLCRGPLEGKDHWCPHCQRIEKGVT